MKPERKVKVVKNLPAAPTGSFMDSAKKHGNTLLTVLLFAAAIYLFVRWRNHSAELAKADLQNQLLQARGLVGSLRNGNFAATGDPQSPLLPPADLIKAANDLQGKVDGLISAVSNATEDPAVRAQAETIKGDLYWQLANLPPMPGSDSEPTLRLNATSDVLLQTSASAYEAATQTSGATPETVAVARLGLAAIAQNKSDWDGSKKLLTQVSDDPTTPPPLAKQAKVQLEMLRQNMATVYLAPPSGVVGIDPSTQPTTAPTMGPLRPTTLPSSMPTTVPGLIPTTGRSLIPTTLPTTRIADVTSGKLAVTRPTTMPGK